MLYPLKFKPILKQTIWGGDKLAYKSNDPKVKDLSAKAGKFQEYKIISRSYPKGHSKGIPCKN